MVKSLDPPELAISSAEGLSFIEYTSAFSTLCSPDRNHREMELRQRKKLKQNLDEPLSQQFYVLNDPNAAGLLVPERELAPCCAKALAALRWWSWLDATLCIGSSNEVRARLSKAKCYRPQWVSENGKLRGISQLDGPKFTTAQRYSIVTWLYRAANPIEGARPEWVGRGRKYPYEVESFIKIFLREYAIAGGDPAPSRPLDAHRAQTSFDQLTDPCTIYLATVWRQLPPRFWRSRRREDQRA